MSDLLDRIPTIDWTLALAVAVAGFVALVSRRRGGRFRALPGWSGFWVGFAAILICLSRASRWVSYPLLAILMFVSLRAYFFVAPVRPRDRYAVLAAYAAIPIALWPAFNGSRETFVATVPIALFLVVPVMLAIGAKQEGLLDSVGRTLLGVIFFVFCIAHLGLYVHQPQPGLPQLFGILVIASELPQRMAGRFESGSGWARRLSGILIGLVLAVGLGFKLGPLCGLVEEDGGRAGALVLLAVTMGATVSGAVARDLSLTSSSSQFGRGAFLNRMAPGVYAAPVFFHYINHFA